MKTTSDWNVMEFNPWLRAMQTLWAFQWKLFKVQYEMSAEILKTALQGVSPDRPPREPVPRCDVDELERVATARLRQGLAPPPEIYQIPYRNRINWALFPEWAKPIDPELFEGSAHEG